MSVVKYDNPGVATMPQPILWKDCSLAALNDLGQGIYLYDRFMSFQALSTSVSPGVVTDNLRFEGDADTEQAIIDDSRFGGIRMETDTTAGDSGALFSQPLGPMVKNSGQKLWMEARIAPGDVDADMGVFVGLVELDGATTAIIADDPATNASVGDFSMLGFFQNNADPNAFNIITKIAGASVIEVLADATNGTGILAASRASLTDGAYHRVGIRFDGRETVEFYVNGYRVATADVTTIDQTQDYCMIVTVKTGAAAAELLDTSFTRAAFQQEC